MIGELQSLHGKTDFVLVNTHHVSKRKELEDNFPTKNDYKDAKVIANLVKDGHYTDPILPTGVYANLRILMNLREGLALTTLLEQYNMFCRQRDEIMAQVEQLLNQIPGTEEMLSVPGMGGTTLAGFLAEVGELQGYDHGQQIIRLAGLNLKENSSGKRKGKTGISKRVRSRLRALLFRAILPMVATNREFKSLHHYYTTRPCNLLKKKQSLIASCGKLIRVLHTLGTKQIHYIAEDLWAPLRKSQIQKAA